MSQTGRYDIDKYFKPNKGIKFRFHFEHPSVRSCDLSGHCGFILKTIPNQRPMKDLQLCTEKEEYVNEKIHFHDEILAENMTVFFSYRPARSENIRICPLSWLYDSPLDENARSDKQYYESNYIMEILYRI